MLNQRWKKILLSTHLILVSVWIGSILSVLILLLSNPLISDPSNSSIVEKVIFTIHDLVIMNVAVAVAITGMLFSALTQWGFLKFWWIIIKWLSILTLAVIIIVFFGPSINGAAAISDVMGNDSVLNSKYIFYRQDAVIYSLIQLTILVFIVFLSVFKPWGKRKIKHEYNRKVVLTIVAVAGLLVIASAAMQYFQLSYYRSLPITEVDLTKLDDGIYIGEANYGFYYKVKVKIKNHSIEDVEFLQNRSSFYARLAEGIKQKILNKQKVDIDAVTGATTTSKVLLKAVETALMNNEVK